MTRGALAPRVSPWPAAQAEEGRRRYRWGEREAEPDGLPVPESGEKGPEGPLDLNHRDGGILPALQLAG